MSARPAQPGGGLRRRLAIALVGLTAAAAAAQGLAYWAAERWVERASLEGLLDRELAHRIATGAAATAVVDVGEPDALRYFRPARGEAVPSELARLAAGWHERVAFAGRHYETLVRDLGADDRVYLLYDISGLEARERRLILLFSVGVLGVAGLALWASQRLSRRALAPLAALVDEIRALNPEARGARLAVDDDNELRVIAQALNGYMAELDALVERERAFAAAASHELRTPLAVIAGAAELLAETHPAAKPLARIERAVTQARFDLDALLALSRVREPPPARTLQLEALLPDWAAPHLAAATTANGAPTLRWQLSAQTVDAAPGSLHIIFTNLLRNALRAAGPRGEVLVTLTASGIRVEDNGSGVPADELPYVFEPHVRGRDGGTGIGLYVARALAQRHGWQLALANRDEGGAVAELRWPTAPAA